jgi:hypothetical protein
MSTILTLELRKTSIIKHSWCSWQIWGIDSFSSGNKMIMNSGDWRLLNNQSIEAAFFKLNTLPPFSGRSASAASIFRAAFT